LTHPALGAWASYRVLGIGNWGRAARTGLIDDGSGTVRTSSCVVPTILVRTSIPCLRRRSTWLPWQN